MAEEAGEDAPFTFHVKSSAEPKYSLTLKPSSTIAEIKQILTGAEYANVPAERQRLIYSGRVLKDSDTLASHKVKEGHTIHLVKSSAATSSSSQSQQQQQSSSSGQAAGRSNTRSTASPAAGVPTNLAAGTGNSMLAGLTGARYAGFSQLPGAGIFGPDGGMGPLPDADQILSMMENPQFQSTMNEALQNPQIIDMMIQQNPMLRDVPNARQMLQSPEFRRMLTDPNILRSMTQMQRVMDQGGRQSAFPAPGVTNTTQREGGNGNGNGNQNTAGNQNTNTQPPPFNPFLGMPGAGGNPFASFLAGMQQPPAGAGAAAGPNQQQQQQQQPNPFASLFNPALFGQPPNPDGQGGQYPQNPFMQNPALFSQLMQAMGGPGADANNNPLHSLFGGQPAQPAQPPDTRPPEERYAEQLRQLNDMGFFEFERNIEALRRSGGSVQGAIEYLLNTP